MLRRNGNRALGVLLVIGMVVSPLAAAQLAICTGTDGHFHLEPLEADCCDHPAPGSGLPGWTADERCVEDCTDLRLASDAATPDRTDRQLPTAFFSQRFAAPPTSLSRAPKRAGRFWDPHPPLHTSTVQRC